MKKKEHLLERIETLKKSGVDMRAEVLANNLLAVNNLQDTHNSENTQVEVLINGVFKRPHSKDIENLEIVEVDSGNVLQFELNREGMYDALPKALFHETRQSRKSTASKENPEARHLKILEEKAQARKLFYPYDQEIFKARLLKESAEADYIKPLGLSTRLKDFRILWGLPEVLPEDSMERLADLIPLASEFAGDLQKTAWLMSFLVDASCEIKEGGMPISMKNDSLIPPLGNLNLATSFTLGGAPPPDNPVWTTRIGPIEKNRISEFLPEGKHRRELELFGDYFFPLHIDVLFEVEVKKEEQGFILSDNPQDGRLAYSSKI